MITVDKPAPWTTCKIPPKLFLFASQRDGSLHPVYIQGHGLEKQEFLDALTLTCSYLRKSYSFGFKLCEVFFVREDVYKKFRQRRMEFHYDPEKKVLTRYKIFNGDRVEAVEIKASELEEKR